jgi:histidinol-phosphate aminotransferase
LNIQIPDHIHDVSSYAPGKSAEDLEQEMGISGAIKMASNENSWGASPKAIRAMRSLLAQQHRYPDGSSSKLREALAGKIGLDASEVVIGNGSSELIEVLIRTFVKEGDEVISSKPSFSLYQQLVRARGGINFPVEQKKYHHDLESILGCIGEKTKLIFLDNPNNPTGSVISPGELYTFLSEVPESVTVILDEAYMEFMDDHFQIDIYSLIRNCSGRCGVVILRTFSKLYGLAGLRIGYGLMPTEIATVLHKVRLPFNINMMAQEAALAALKDESYYTNILALIKKEREKLIVGMKMAGVKVNPTQANFFMVDVGKDSAALYESMLKEGIILRSLHSFGLPQCLRVTICKEEQNTTFLEKFSQCLKKEKYV